MNLAAARGVAVREFVMKPPHGRADYLLFVDGKAVGVIEAKKEGETLTGVEWQSAKYVDGVPTRSRPRSRAPLPFVYESTGVETRFTNGLDPEPRSREVFSFHRPETLAGWLAQIHERPDRADPPPPPARLPPLDADAVSGPPRSPRSGTSRSRSPPTARAR